MSEQIKIKRFQLMIRVIPTLRYTKSNIRIKTFSFKHSLFKRQFIWKNFLLYILFDSYIARYIESGKWINIINQRANKNHREKKILQPEQ